MLPDSDTVDDALVALLAGDVGAGGLISLMPDGVWFDDAGHGKTRYVLIRQLAHEDHNDLFDGETGPTVAWEKFTYLVKAVEQSVTGASAKAAASRIRALLQGGTLAPAGYDLMVCQRIERVSYRERDPDNEDARRWHHRGGQYEIWVSPQG